jgi:site-specific DNA recombinase
VSAGVTSMREERGSRPASGMVKQTGPKPLRCAIYTRKSTENGLEQEFNSLDNQREAAEAYIKSQAHEGWRLLPGAYDDGGFSGGSLERPAIQRLLAEVRAGRVDVIVVYKVDRLTRSLSDFAKLVDLFDQHGVSFVSVTQAFNTTTSMGRLTLNVLLSFAQFEREVTGERIRDKIAASKKKGMRVGGPVPLGYQVRDKKLVACPAEADQVTLIFRGYLELGSLTFLLQDLRERGILTKASPRRDGSIRGGIPFDRGGLAALLKNRTYVGEVIHKGRHFAGEHQPIVARDLFEAVQTALTAKARNRGTTTLNRGSLLQGLLYDEQGNRMAPSTAKKNGARYRYYVSNGRLQGRGAEAGPISRVSAPDIEAAVLQALGIDPAAPLQTSLIDGEPSEQASLGEQVHSRVERVILRRGAIEIVSRGDEEDQAGPMIVPWSPAPNRRKRAVIGGEAVEPTAARPIRSETRARLLSGMANARVWLDELASGSMADTKAIALRQGCSERHVRSTLNLAFLAPEIVRAAVDGTLPDGFGVVALAEMQADWIAQRRAVTVA